MKNYKLTDENGNLLLATVMSGDEYKIPEKQIIYVAGYPKSGTTWLTRLLGDVLNSPTGGCMPSEDASEVATGGQYRSGSYIVRKGHFVLIDDDTGPVVPRPHRLTWQQLTNERIVFLVRDPRDICVSGAWHWRVTSEQFLDRMIKGDVARCGRWDKYVDKWLSYKNALHISYEDLIKNPAFSVNYILNNALSLNALEINKLKDCIMRQSFAARKFQIGDDRQELRRNNMRKGIAGDWHNHFTPEMNERIWNEFGRMMERLGYGK